MSEKILKISIFVAVLTGLLIYSTFFIVKETHQAIVLQLGEPKKVYKDAGLYFKIPLIQNVHFLDKRVIDIDAPSEEVIALDQKNKLLETVKLFELTDDKDKNLEALNDFSSQWKKTGRVVQSKRFIDGKFFKILDGFYSKLGLDKKVMEDLKYTLKLETLAQDQRLFNNEVTFIRKKMDEIKSEINQLENNLQFFSNVKDDNPMVKEVHKNIDKHKAALQTWNAKYSKIKKMIQ